MLIILFSYLILISITLLLDIQNIILESKLQNKRYKFSDAFDKGIFALYILLTPLLFIIIIISYVEKLINLYNISWNDSRKIKNNLNIFNQLYNFFVEIENEDFYTQCDETYKMIFLRDRTTTYSDSFQIKYLLYSKVIEIQFKNHNFRIHNSGKFKPYYKALLEKIDTIYKSDFENTLINLARHIKKTITK